MEKVKLILLLFSISIYSQSETLSQNDLINTKKIADSLLKNKNYLEATSYYEKLVIYKADNFDYVFNNMQTKDNFNADGFGAEIFSFKILKKVHYLAKKKSDFEFKIAHFSNHNFYETLKEKLLWGKDKRN